MPGLDGIGLSDWYHSTIERFKRKAAPVILHTAYPEDYFKNINLS